jgi:hypothetical protein
MFFDRARENGSQQQQDDERDSDDWIHCARIAVPGCESIRFL